MAASLPHDVEDLCHIALIEQTDRKVDLLHQGSARYTKPLQVVDTGWRGAEVTGQVCYDQVFATCSGPLPSSSSGTARSVASWWFY